MDNPNVFTELHRIDHAERVTAKWQGNLEPPEPKPRIGFAMSALPPSAAIVKAVRQVDRTPSGKVSNSLSAALIHETGRVLMIICRRR